MHHKINTRSHNSKTAHAKAAFAFQNWSAEFGLSWEKLKKEVKDAGKPAQPVKHFKK